MKIVGVGGGTGLPILLGGLKELNDRGEETLFDGLAEAISASPAAKGYVCYLMTQPGETPGYSAGDHLRGLQSYSPRAIDLCVVNSKAVGTGLAQRYSSGRQY